ncbi:uncharacterized protein EV420DRAFT_1706810 [Desarmillaria tabescens]|uniref:Uncharacterized protein n=1 Tax=Armillaria tabescens TaxID=1929756 RepID=A0AA39JXR3_ARMTA|nr:uncharacterized protein EV420DRAFT_1706810 [Desarmillaria tabescens]KAK0449756.1 hypothetical protein EV420DRAFT_1706810 [Desarmillaria tabescens]
MLDYVHDWNNLRTRVYLDEKLLAALRNPDRARVVRTEHYLNAVPSIPHSNPFKSKTPFQASSSDLSWEGVHYTATRDEEQHPSNSRVTKTQSQFCQSANSKVTESQDFGLSRYESLPAVSHRARIPEDLDCRNPSAHKSIYQGCAPSDLDSSRGGNNGNRLPSRCSPCNSQIPAYPSHLEYTSIDFDTALKATDIPACNSNSNTRDNCENKSINTAALNHNIGNPIPLYSTNNEIRTFQIASNTPCIPFSERNKASRLPRKVRRHIDRLQKRLLRMIYATHRVTFNNGDCQRILMGMREYVLRLSGFTIMGSEATRVPVGVNTPDLNVLQMVFGSDSYIMRNFRIALRMIYSWPKVRVEQKTKFVEPTGETECRLHRQCLIRHGIEVESAIVLSPIDREPRDFEVRALAEAVSKSTKFTRLQSYHRTQKYHRRRQVPRAVGAKMCIVIPAKPQPTAGSDFQFHGVSLTSPTDVPTIPITLEDTMTERNSNRLLTKHPRSSESNTASLKCMPEKTERDQLNQNIQLSISSNDIPRSVLIMPITVSPVIPAGNNETSVLGCSTDLAPTWPILEIHTTIVGLRQCSIDASGGNFEGICVEVEVLANSYRRRQEGSQYTRPLCRKITNIRGKVTIKPSIAVDSRIERKSNTFGEELKLRVTTSASKTTLGMMRQQNEVHDQYHHQYRSHFGNSSPATTKADSPCYHRTMEPSSIHASPKLHSGVSCDGKYLESSINVKPGTRHGAQTFCQHLKHYPIQGELRHLGYGARISTHVHSLMAECVLFLEQHISRETHQQQGYDAPYHLVSLSVFHISNVCGSPTAVGNWNTTSPVCVPGKGSYGVCRGSQGMKRRPHTTRKSQRIKTVRNLHQLTSSMIAQTIPDVTSKEFSTVSERDLITTIFHCLPGFTFTLADKELGEITVHRVLHRVQDSRFSSIFTVLRDLITGLGDRQQHLQRIPRSPQLEFLVPGSISFPRSSVYRHRSIIAEVAVIKPESKRLLTDHPRSVAFDTVSLRLNWIDKTEHNQLNQRVWLINSSSNVLSDIFITYIAISHSIPSGHVETSLLERSTGLAPTEPLSEVEVIGHKRCLHASGNEVTDTETSRQCKKVDTMSSVNGTMAESIRRRNHDGAHHQYHSRFRNCSEEPALANSPLHRTKPSSIRVSSDLRLFPSKHKGRSNPLKMVPLGIYSYTCLLLRNKFVIPARSSTHVTAKGPACNAISKGNEPCAPM